ncbi:MAG: transposase, partial [Caldisphaeraceae archaeon]|nr:transposase [Caldisphaeraceae archaeon]
GFKLCIQIQKTSRRCHRCGYITKANGREFRCPKCGLTYNRDLNAAINIAHTLTRGMGLL